MSKRNKMLQQFENHKTSRQIIVDLKELRYQLQDMMFEDNLISCILIGRNHREYKKLLYLVSLKFEFISGMVYVDKQTAEIAKLSIKEYKKLLFDNYCDNIEEMKMRIEFSYKKFTDLKDEINDELVNKVFKKYSVLKDLCCYMIATPTDFTSFVGEFAFYIDYIINLDDSMPVMGFKNGFPENLPNCYDDSENEVMAWINNYQFRH